MDLESSPAWRLTNTFKIVRNVQTVFVLFAVFPHICFNKSQHTFPVLCIIILYLYMTNCCDKVSIFVYVTFFLTLDTEAHNELQNTENCHCMDVILMTKRCCRADMQNILHTVWHLNRERNQQELCMNLNLLLNVLLWINICRQLTWIKKKWLQTVRLWL